MTIVRQILIFLAITLLAGCTTFEYHETRPNQLDRVIDTPSSTQNVATLLDVGIVLLDPGVDEMDDESMAYANVRRSEAVWFSEKLKNSFDNSNAWGIVRTLPNDNTIFDLTVQGHILDSNGEDVRLQIDAFDATGKHWLSKEYFERVSQYAYNPELELGRDPFQNLFNNIANDLFALRETFSEAQLLMIREVARMRFAEDFAPEAFAGYLDKSEEDTYWLRRMPAQNDPMIERVEKIRARNDLFLDVIQDYYRVFNNNMALPYDEWRKLSYKEVLYERQIAKQAKQEKITGVALILSGVLAATSNSSVYTRGAGHVGIITGADVFHKSFQTEADAARHAETLREFGESLEVELEPSVIDLQDRTITLSGTVEDQFKEWRLILQEMFEAEQSILLPGQLDDADASVARDADAVAKGIAKPKQISESILDGAL